MSHPFLKDFVKALSLSTNAENKLLYRAQHYIDKGYSKDEVVKVLNDLRKSLLDDEEVALVLEAIDELVD